MGNGESNDSVFGQKIFTLLEKHIPLEKTKELLIDSFNHIRNTEEILKLEVPTLNEEQVSQYKEILKILVYSLHRHAIEINSAYANTSNPPFLHSPCLIAFQLCFLQKLLSISIIQSIQLNSFLWEVEGKK